MIRKSFVRTAPSADAARDGSRRGLRPAVGGGDRPRRAGRTGRASRWSWRSSLPADDEAVDRAIRGLLDEFVAGRAAPGRDVLDASRHPLRATRSRHRDGRPLMAWAVFTIGIGHDSPRASTRVAISDRHDSLLRLERSDEDDLALAGVEIEGGHAFDPVDQGSRSVDSSLSRSMDSEQAWMSTSPRSLAWRRVSAQLA